MKFFYYLFIISVFYCNLLAQTIEEKIAQMLMIGFSGTAVEDTILINDIQKRKIGGVILFGGNITSPLQLINLTNQLQSMSVTPLFISIDQEGGQVARLRLSNGYADTYSAYKIGTILNNESSTRLWASTMAGWLDDANININLAPVVDVNVNPLSPAIGLKERSFSRKPDTVYYHADLFINEFNRKKIFTTLKHFPGHGSAIGDSHLGFTDITNTWSDSELIPYRKLINDGYNDFIMSGHLFNANIDSVYPASLSNKAITKLLKDSLGFNGLIITDGMFMGAITNNYEFHQSLELAINAGNDILLYTTNKLNGKSLVDSVIRIVKTKLIEGKITEERINYSYNKIISKKQELLSNRDFVNSLIPDEFSIRTYPNPFNPSTNILITLNSSSTISLKLYNSIGEEICVIASGYFSNGSYQFYFNGNTIPSGIYFLVLNANGNFKTLKIVLMK